MSNKHLNDLKLFIFLCELSITLRLYPFSSVQSNLYPCQLCPPLCRTVGLVFQSENFNYNRYNNYAMDSWSYMESPVLEQNHPKPRLHPGDDLAALTMLYEQCKVEHVESVVMTT